MQKYVLFLLLVTMGCGGSLSDEQRKELREGQAKQEIKRVTDSEILAQAFTTGRAIMGAIGNDSTVNDQLAERAVAAGRDGRFDCSAGTLHSAVQWF